MGNCRHYVIGQYDISSDACVLTYAAGTRPTLGKSSTSYQPAWL